MRIFPVLAGALACVLFLNCASPRSDLPPDGAAGGGGADGQPTAGSTGTSTVDAPANLDATAAEGGSATSLDATVSGPIDARTDGVVSDADGAVTCPAGFFPCDGVCVDGTKPEHCAGSCTACPTVSGGQATCDGKQCGVSCPGGKIACQTACIDQSTPCTGTCPAGTHNCSNLCVSDTSANACGPKCLVCPTPAGGTGTCVNDTCSVTCSGSLAPCNGACVDLQTSGQNCGACGTKCTSGQACQGGACVAICGAAGQPCCDGAKDSCSNKCKTVTLTCANGQFDRSSCPPADVECCNDSECPTCQKCSANGKCTGGYEGENSPGCNGECMRCQSGSCQAKDGLTCGNKTTRCGSDNTLFKPDSCRGGSCQQNGTACGNLTCSNDSCACPKGTIEQGGTCVTDGKPGSTCSGNNDCTSNNCDSGVCCAAGCVADDTHPCFNGGCDSTGKCAIAPHPIACSRPFCDATTLVTRQCDPQKTGLCLETRQTCTMCVQTGTSAGCTP